MNLNESFRYQNTLSLWIEELNNYLSNSDNVTTSTTTHYMKVANPDADDKVEVSESLQKYPYLVKDIILFVKALIDEKADLNNAISKAKKDLPIDIDSAVSLNKIKQSFCRTLSRVNRNQETTRKTEHIDYMLNVEKVQVTYRYKGETVTKLDFIPEEIKKISKEIQRENDEISCEIDKLMVMINLDFNPQYDMLDSLKDIMAQKLKAPEKE